MSRKITTFVATLLFIAVAMANHNETAQINKRQSLTHVADFYFDAGATGSAYSSLYAYSGYDSQRSTDNNGNPIIASGGYGITSLRLYDQNWLIEIYGNTACSGGASSSLAFRTLAPINNLADYGYNDWALCLKAVYKGTPSGAATLFEDSNFVGRSSYITTGAYPNIATASPYLNNVRGDTLSSMELYALTQVDLYKDANYGGQHGGVTPSSKVGLTITYSSMASVQPTGFCNDCASSIIVS